MLTRVGPKYYVVFARDGPIYGVFETREEAESSGWDFVGNTPTRGPFWWSKPRCHLEVQSAPLYRWTREEKR